MPTTFPSPIFPTESSPFLKMLESPFNLQVIFYITIFTELTLDELQKKLGEQDSDRLLEILERMKSMGIVEEHIENGIKYYRSSSVEYHSLQYEEYKEFTEDQLRHYMNEEFLYSYRIISLLKSILGKIVHYMCDFYIKRIQDPSMDLGKVKTELKYETTVPRIGFVTKEEFEIYKTKFLEFENAIIQELMTRRKRMGLEKNPSIEYIISSLIIPIKKIIDRS